MRVPRDIHDLHLAPLLLALEDRLRELGLLNSDELGVRVATESNRPDRSQEMRRSNLMLTVERFIDCHGWQLAWHERGIRVSRDALAVVLGTPQVFQSYVDGPAQTGAGTVIKMPANLRSP